ncbi:MAG: hypothetical protein K6C13_06660 [Oscillospiraceae bacterium]|nr:hypothetical protein [Oscillospiraceae bacterium]
MLCEEYDLVLAAEERFDLKGFVFAKRTKETAEISASENKGIYGDSSRSEMMPLHESGTLSRSASENLISGKYFRAAFISPEDQLLQ